MSINIVLFEPEIPQNTGNIMRSCVGFNANLHLIKPLGFSLSEKHLKRSGLDYIKHLNYKLYDDFEDFFTKNKGDYYYLTRYAHNTLDKLNFENTNDIYLIFGKESTGIPYEILKNNLDKCYRIPTTDKVRSLNLSNCVAITLFQVTSTLGYPGLICHEPDSLKGEFFLENFKK